MAVNDKEKHSKKNPVKKTHNTSIKERILATSFLNMDLTLI